MSTLTVSFNIYGPQRARELCQRLFTANIPFTVRSLQSPLDEPTGYYEVTTADQERRSEFLLLGVSIAMEDFGDSTDEAGLPSLSDIGMDPRPQHGPYERRGS